MKIKFTEKEAKSFLLMLIPFFIHFALDGTFSIQSIILILILLFLIDIRHNKIRINRSLFIVLLCFFISTTVSMSINLILNNDLISNITYIRIVSYAAILYLYISFTRIKYNEKQIKLIMTCKVISSLLLSLSLIFINHIWYKGILGTIIDKNFSGAILAFDALITLLLFFQEKKVIIKIMYILIYIIMLIGIFFSASRASILVVLLGSFISIFMKMEENVKTKKEILKLFFMMFLLPLFILFIFIIISHKISGASSSIQWYWDRYFVNGFGDSSVTGRWLWWKNALTLWINRPFFGYGIGNINVSGNSSAVTHNTYLDFLLDQGLLGIIGFLIVLFKTFQGVTKNKKYIALIVIILLNIFIFSANKSLYLWYNLIIIYILNNPQKTDRKEENNEK